jgi:hypothetical protein
MDTQLDVSTPLVDGTSEDLSGASEESLLNQLAVELENETEAEAQTEPENTESDETVNEDDNSDDDVAADDEIEEAEVDEQASEEDTIDFDQVVEFSTVIDGEETKEKVALRDLTASYQRQASFVKKEQALAESQTKAKEAQAQFADAYQARLQEVSDILQVASPALARLNQSGMTPENYLAAVQKQAPDSYQAEYNEIMHIVQSQGQLANQRQAQEAAELKEQYAREEEKLLTALPEWSDRDLAKSEVTAIGKYLVGSGFTQAEALEIMAHDHRYTLMLRDAVKGQQPLKAVKKRSKKVLKSVKQKGNTTGSSSQKKIADAQANSDYDTLTKELENLL